MARARLVDVAERAGVSMKTVSNVVHGYAHVSPEVRTRVQAAIGELGYRPNIAARQLVTGRTGMIALAVPELDHPYFSELASHVAERAPSFGCRVLIEQTLSDIEAERAVLRDREAGLVDGVIFQPMRMDAAEIIRIPKDVPVVLLGEAALPENTDHVMIDNLAAVHIAMATLSASGRRHVAFLGRIRDDRTGSTLMRLQGYEESRLELHMDAHPDLVLPADDFSVLAGQLAVEKAVNSGVVMDAIVCRDDRLATGALRGLAHVGLRVPQDVAVVGWDDTQLARYSNPSLTSVSPDKLRIAELALGLLQDRIEGFDGPGRHVLAPFHLERRESA